MGVEEASGVDWEVMKRYLAKQFSFNLACGDFWTEFGGGTDHKKRASCQKLSSQILKKG